MIFSEQNDMILNRFAECRRLVVNPAKTKQNTHLKNHYATLKDVADAVDPAMLACDLMLIQSPTHEEGQAANVLLMESRLIHLPTGQYMSDICQIPLPKADCQGFGSALTYARRYSKIALFDLSMSDDDGNKGTRTAADAKRSIDSASTEEEIDQIYRASMEYFKDDKASMRIVQDARASAIVKLKQANARPFNPGNPDGAKKGRSRVVVETAPEEPQNTAPPVADGPEEDF